MKSASAPLVTTLYSGNEYEVADLYDVVLTSGTYRWTSGMVDVSWGGNTYSAAPTGPGLRRGTARSTAGLDIATMDVTMFPGAVTVAGSPLLLASVRGAFDMAGVTITRAFFVSGLIVGTEVVFAGSVVEVKPGTTELVLTVRSSLALIDVQIPKRFIQTTCPYTVYSASTCKVNPAAFTDATKTVAAGSTTTILKLSAVSTNVVPGSIITITSGTLSGTKCQIAKALADVVNPNRAWWVTQTEWLLASPLTSAPAAGVTLSIVRGCEKTKDVCSAVFANLLRFGGFPDAPKSTG